MVEVLDVLEERNASMFKIDEYPSAINLEAASFSQTLVSILEYTASHPRRQYSS
jgi:hypothetical protein